MDMIVSACWKTRRHWLFYFSLVVNFLGPHSRSSLLVIQAAAERMYEQFEVYRHRIGSGSTNSGCDGGTRALLALPVLS